MGRFAIRVGITSLLLGGLALFAQAPAPKPGRVTVTVVNSVTGVPIPGAKLVLDRTRGGSPVTGETGADGTVELSTPPGDYLWSIGTLPRGFTASVPGAVRITVRDGETVPLGTVPLIPPGAIQGIVKDDAGKPVANAQVNVVGFGSAPGNLLSLNPKGIAFTDTEGRYRIADVPPGPVLVRVSARSNITRVFALTYYPAADSFQQAARLQVPPGRDLEHIDFEVRRVQGFHVRGTVALDAASVKPSVQIQPCGPGPEDMMAVTLGTLVLLQADGRFDFTDTPPGEHCVIYRETDRAQSNKILRFATATARVIDRDVDGLQLIPSAPRSIRGVVQLEEGGQLKMPSLVYLFGANSYPLPTLKAEVDPDTGTFEANGALPVNYRVSVPAGNAFVQSASLGTREVGAGSFAYSGETEPLTIHLAAARGMLQGKVVGGTGPSSHQYAITATPTGALSQRRDLIKTASTTANGEFLLPGLAPGSYRIYAWEARDYYMWTDLPEFLERFPATTVEVKDQQVTGVEVRMISTAEVERAKASF